MASKEQDLELFHTWKASGDKKDLGKLVHALAPIIYSEVQRASGTLPTSALSAEAKVWAVKAIETFDPTKGVALSTHVMNYLPKVRRLNYKFQNSARLPENLQLQYHSWHQATTRLQEQLERDPTDEELAHQLGWKKKAVIKYKNSLYSDLVESASERPTETHTFNKNKVLYDYILEQLTPEEKTIFENIDTMTSTELAVKLGVNINRLNYLKRILIDKVKKLQSEVKWSS
jgi:DNA-directed RNA polymerase specialized sigma subunit